MDWYFNQMNERILFWKVLTQKKIDAASCQNAFKLRLKIYKYFGIITVKYY